MNASRKVLVVDDDESIRQLLSAFLESLGHQVLAAKSLKDAKTPLADQDLALAIVDVNLERKDVGQDARAPRSSNAIARHLCRRKIPVIRVTGTLHELHPEFHPGGRFPAVGVLGKPFTLAQLHGLVAKALNQS